MIHIYFHFTVFSTNLKMTHFKKNKIKNNVFFHDEYKITKLVQQYEIGTKKNDGRMT